MKRSPLRPRSVKGQRYQQEYLEMAEVVHERSGGQCEIIAQHDCGHYVTYGPHHRKMRSQGGSNDPDNLLDVCWKGHQWIHSLPRLLAYDLQLLVPRDYPEYPYSP